MKHDGVSVTAVIVLASFVIERLTAGMLFLLSSSERWRRRFVDPLTSKNKSERAKAERQSKWIHFALAGSLVSLLLWLNGNIGVLHALGIEGYNDLDPVFTWLILVAGSDRLGELLKSESTTGDEHAMPIEIRGRVMLVEDSDSRSTAADQRLPVTESKL